MNARSFAARVEGARPFAPVPLDGGRQSTRNTDYGADLCQFLSR